MDPPNPYIPQPPRPPNARRDAYRRGPLRYFGLAYEMAMCAFPLVPLICIPFGRTVRNTYITLDMVDKTFLVNRKRGFFSGVAAGIDVAVWHLFATIIFPGCALRTLRLFLFRYFIMPPTPQFITLASIPFIVPFGDTTTEILMNSTYRQIFGRQY